MKTKILLAAAFFLFSITGLQAQLKVGDNPTTINTSAVLDAESITKGFLPPRMTTTQRNAIASPANGLIIYNTTLQCLQINKGTPTVPEWECIGASAAPTVSADCAAASFNGTYISGVTMGSSNTFTITITNNSFSTATIAFASTDLVLSGVSGITVGTPTGSPALGSGNTATLIGGASVTLTYPLSGTPGATGTLTGVWTKLSLSCTKTKSVTGVAAGLGDNTYCTDAATRLNGTYTSTVAFTAGNTFTVKVTNNSGSAVNGLPAPAVSNLSLTWGGTGSLTVASVSPNTTFNLANGASQTITYTLSGTPSSCGTLTASWAYGGDYTCSKNVTVNPNVSCGTGSWTTAVSPSAAGGLITSTAYTGTYSIPYTGGGCTLPAESYTINGLTLSYAGGAVSATGSLTYTLSGTYTGANNGYVIFTTAHGCNVSVGLLASCNAIKTANPSATDGVYWIDPDGAGTTYSPMQAQCDMTTDGGGWTMIVNYLHAGGTTPNLTSRAYFPIIGSSTLGTDESSLSSNWGHTNQNLLSIMLFSEIRYTGKTTRHTRIVDFKTNNAAHIAAVKSTSGNTNASAYTCMAGASGGSWVALPDHTASLPNIANQWFNTTTVDTHAGIHWLAGRSGVPRSIPWQGTSNLYNLGYDGWRWEVDDDYTAGRSPSTLHRIWVR